MFTECSRLRWCTVELETGEAVSSVISFCQPPGVVRLNLIHSSQWSVARLLGATCHLADAFLLRDLWGPHTQKPDARVHIRKQST